MRVDKIGAAILVLGLGCSSDRISYDELPSSPVAVAVRSEDDTERYQQVVQKEAEELQEGRSNLPTNDPLERARMQLENMILIEQNRARFTRLMFLDPIERDAERVDFASKGARPLSWTVDRTRLLYQAIRNNRSQLFEWNRETSEVRQVTFGRPHVDGAQGPEGRIAAVRRSALRQVGGEVVGGFQIYVSDVAGGDLRRVSDGPLDIAPTFSPDGRLVIFEHWDSNGVESLRSIDLANGDTLSRPLARGRSPVFTPDGEWVVYSARTRSGYRLWKMHPDGTGRRSLGSSGLQEFDPSVAPGGQFVVYVGLNPASESGPQILVKRIDGSNPRQLSIEGSGLLPVW